MEKIVVIWTIVMLSEYNLPAQYPFTYGSKIAPIELFSAKRGLSLFLPRNGELTLLYFAFANVEDTKANAYFSSLRNMTNKINIFQITINKIKEGTSCNDHLLRPVHSEQLQSLWEIFLKTKENPILLVDRECRVVFCGFLDSPENFNQILERLGIDFSLQQDVTLTSFLTEYATLLQFKTGRTIDEQSYVKSKNSKIVLLYRSFCVPCGEDLLIREILNYRKSVRPNTLDYICIFRRIGEKENLQLDEILESSDPDFMHIYEAQKPNPAIERFFLKGNPLLLIFDADNNLAKTRAINRMSPNLLTTVLNSIP